MLYLIKKYEQKSNNFFINLFDCLTSLNRVSNFITFKSAPKYRNKNKNVRTINRLFGTYNLLNNKSIGFGWEYYQHEIYLYGYYFFNNKPQIKFIQKIKIDETYIMTIFNKKDFYILTLIDSKDNIKQIKFNTVKLDTSVINLKKYPKLKGSNIALNTIEIDLIPN